MYKTNQPLVFPPARPEKENTDSKSSRTLISEFTLDAGRAEAGDKRRPGGGAVNHNE